MSVDFLVVFVVEREDKAGAGVVVEGDEGVGVLDLAGLGELVLAGELDLAGDAALVAGDDVADFVVAAFGVFGVEGVVGVLGLARVGVFGLDVDVGVFDLGGEVLLPDSAAGVGLVFVAVAAVFAEEAADLATVEEEAVRGVFEVGAAGLATVEVFEEAGFSTTVFGFSTPVLDVVAFSPILDVVVLSAGFVVVAFSAGFLAAATLLSLLSVLVKAGFAGFTPVGAAVLETDLEAVVVSPLAVTGLTAAALEVAGFALALLVVLATGLEVTDLVGLGTFSSAA